MNEIYLVIDSTQYSNSDNIQGVFDDEIEAKLFLADYVLESENVESCFIELVKKEVKVSSKFSK